ncbi:hypothetical protein [Thiohalobacter thiocyanaticus]|uniref:Uncharacterized protein n=1 Tax=Thiohalobacter thiocyanaticus TaxID=585455 RepID=A0A426QFJ9_9GAMM|nr:hypothetical protein [Thiohalobacter thiocyanaticus]RRQ20529.1 hypothetical protein D6C00_00010 [Thiohalobacter thiocyanaticus]
MNYEIPKELITALRSLKRKHGATVFNAAIEALAYGELSLTEGKRGRPKVPDAARLLFSYAEVQARMDIDEMTKEEAAKDIEANPSTFISLEEGAGGTLAPRNPTFRCAKTILKLYHEALKYRKEYPESNTEAFDTMLDQARKMRLLLQQRK